MAKRILNNVKLLYAVFILTVFELFYFIYNKDNQSIFLFAVIALIVNFFNNNMIIVLCFTIICVNGLILLNKFNECMLEGMENEGMEELKPKEQIEPLPKLENIKHTKKELVKELLPLTKAIDGLDIDEVNKMISGVNKFIERF